jgi:hypothetical protein
VARPIRLLGAPDRFISFGSQQDQLRESGLTTPQVVETALELWRSAGGAPVRLRRVQG